jgi:hypothetical protein
MENKFDVTFLIGSATRDRPPEKFVLKSIENINEISKNSKYTYEILITSEHEVKGDNVRWIKEEIFSDGCVGAYNSLVSHAKGKYLVFGTDDCFFDDQFYTCIDLLESNIYKNRKLKMLCLGTDNGLGSFLPRGYPKYTVFRVPVISKDTIMNYMNGYIFNPAFKNHYADNWLGFWLTSTFDETIIEIWNTTLHTPDGAPSYNHHNNHDEAVFHQLVQNYISGKRSYV